MCSLIALWTHFSKCRWRSVFLKVVSNQIKSNHFYCHITTAQVPWWVKFLRACSRQCKKNKKNFFTYGQYVFTDCTEDNVQNTHTYTQYTQCTIKTYLVCYVHGVLASTYVMLSCLQITTLNKFMFYLLFNLCFALFNNSEYRSVYIYIALMRLEYWSVGVSVW